MKTDAAFYYLDEEICQCDLALKCIGYLSLPVFAGGYCHPQELQERPYDWPLLLYAAYFWTKHLGIATNASEAGLSPSFSVGLNRFFSSIDTCDRGGNFAAWYQVVFPEGNPKIWMTHPLYTAARQGLLPVVKAILASEGTDTLERRGGRTLSTPLHVAATYGHLDVVKELLRQSANPNETNSLGECGLNWAHFYGYTDVVNALIAGGADSRRIYQGLGRPIHVPGRLPAWMKGGFDSVQAREPV
ncbi:MAG: hypothetical protein Q9159_003719 [Coniocarpon cinnabarinum]